MFNLPPLPVKTAKALLDITKPSETDALAQRAVRLVFGAHNLKVRAYEMGDIQGMLACDQVLAHGAIAIARLDVIRPYEFLGEPDELVGLDARQLFALNTANGLVIDDDQIAEFITLGEESYRLLDAQIPKPAVTIRGMPGVRILRGYHADKALSEMPPAANDAVAA